MFHKLHRQYRRRGGQRRRFPRPAGVMTLAAGTAATTTAGAAVLVAGALPATAAFRAKPQVIAGGDPAPAPPNPLGLTLTWKASLPDAGRPVAQSSPTPATIGGVPSVVVGDRSGRVYAYPLAPADPARPTPDRGWPAVATGPVDSTPSVGPAGSSAGGDIYVGAGNAFNTNQHGGYQAFSPTGRRVWTAGIHNPAGDGQPAQGVQASLAVTRLGRTPAVVAGSLGQEEYALATSNGAAIGGWPFFTSDSVFSTAAVGDLYGNGQTEIVEGGDQTAGRALGQRYDQGGHLRILNASGGLICRGDTTQTVDSSPAIGRFLAGGAVGIVVGTGSFFPGASDSNRVIAYNTGCGRQWVAQLDGATDSSPALADVLGNGQLQVVEGTDNGKTGSVWALDAATGKVLWRTHVGHRVMGSVVTADLTGAGHQDVVVPTTLGVYILDGKTGRVIQTLLGTTDPDGSIGFQNAPLVTDDPNGTIGLTFAGYSGRTPRGYLLHYEIAGSTGTWANETGGWPMFHHDPQLTGNAGNARPGEVPECLAPSAAVAAGYRLVAADGGVFSFGGQPFCGSGVKRRLNAPVIGMATAPGTGGYWMVAADGGVFAYGGARFYGSPAGHRLNQPIVAMAATPNGRGYWLVSADGGVFAYGDASFYGSAAGGHLNSKVVGIAATADGRGYWLVAADGGVFAYGDAPFEGSVGGQHLNAPITGMGVDTATGGYWLVASDGGIFSFGAPYHGSTGSDRLHKPIVAIQPTLNGAGYRLVASDGGVFAFGAAGYAGSLGGHNLHAPVVGIAGI